MKDEEALDYLVTFLNHASCGNNLTMADVVKAHRGFEHVVSRLTENDVDEPTTTDEDSPDD